MLSTKSLGVKFNFLDCNPDFVYCERGSAHLWVSDKGMLTIANKHVATNVSLMEFSR